MEWFRRETNPWGQEILIGLAWDIIWLAVAGGVLFIVAHWIAYYRRWRAQPSGGGAEQDGRLTELPERIPRHSLASRIFHWAMATSVLVLLFTGFLPILGLKFPWVAPHWIAGWVLTAAILFHIVHASFWKGLNLMWISREDLEEGWLVLKEAFGSAVGQPAKPGKNPFGNKLYHHSVSLATLATIITGVIMMAKVDTPWWNRNPYVLSDGTWGIVYVTHGVGSVALITLIMAHLYFAVRPEKRWLTLSMIFGWISRDYYLRHHDPKRWPVVAMPSDEAVTALGIHPQEGRQEVKAP